MNASEPLLRYGDTATYLGGLVTVERRSSDYHASLAANRGVWGSGNSIDAAIGALVGAYPEHFRKAEADERQRVIDALCEAIDDLIHLDHASGSWEAFERHWGDLFTAGPVKRKVLRAWRAAGPYRTRRFEPGGGPDFEHEGQQATRS